MYRKALGFIARYKYTAALIALAGSFIIAFVIIMRMNNTAQPLEASSTVPPVTPDHSSSPATPATEPGRDAGEQLEPLSVSVKQPFQYAVCPPEMNWIPQTEIASGFTPVEQPARQRLGAIKQVSVGHVFDGAGYGSEYGTSYALREDGTVYRWGVFEWGRQARPSAFPQKVSGLPGTVIQLDGRFALLEGGDIYDLNAESGKGKIAGLPKATALAQAEDSSVYVLGQDGRLQLLSMSGPDSHPSITEVTGWDEISSIKASPFITLALDKEGRLRLAQGPFANAGNKTSVPLDLPDGAKALRIETTMSSETPAFVLSDKGDWFQINDQGQLKAVPVPKHIVQITASQHASVALKDDGTVWAWGNSSNLMGSGSQRIEPDHPRQLEGLTGIKAIATGTDHLLALTNDGHILTVGSNMYGQLGQQPIYAADPQLFGTWAGIDALFPFENRLMTVTHGDLWALSYDGSAKPIVLGHNITKAIAALGHFAALTADGRLLVADPEETKPCRVLQASVPIVDAASAANGLLLAISDGRVFLIEGNMAELEQAKELSFHPKPVGKVTQVFGELVPFALTDKGELYYNQRTENGSIIMEKINLPAAVKQWSPIHSDFSDGVGFIGKVLDMNNQVHDLALKLNYSASSNGRTASVTISPTGRQAISLAGGAEIDKNGRIYELGSNMPIDTQLPSGSRLQASGSLYHYFIEGRAYFYHFFVAENGVMYWLGDRPHTGAQRTPGFVVLTDG
ncbi:RCC1 domain-containing protein [Paenibacillus sp. UNC451MF]|uniref:RCC1 domain-containing protein n=1 Tax=Paenibacillus sp. UNC451MF TaxID=1449063 RepID=UPI00048C0CA6|nr:hypothetical protein [Paenibacillus sp. UNC451MF]